MDILKIFSKNYVKNAPINALPATMIPNFVLLVIQCMKLIPKTHAFHPKSRWIIHALKIAGHVSLKNSIIAQCV